MGLFRWRSRYRLEARCSIHPFSRAEEDRAMAGTPEAPVRALNDFDLEAHSGVAGATAVRSLVIDRE